MNRHDVALLQAVRGYPALSILLPTHRSAPDNKQDPIRLKNLTTQATDRLVAEFTKREVQSLLGNLEAAVREVDFRYTLDGLALFANSDFARSFVLPFRLAERVAIDETFATRDLVFAMNRSPRYWVLALSEKPTRLYEGARDTLVEVRDLGFPMVHEGPGGSAPLPGGFGVRKSAYRDEQQRKFFRQVDSGLAAAMADDPLPLVLVGVERNLTFFSEVTAYRAAIVASLTGSHDRTSAHDLGKLVWPLAEAGFAGRRASVLQELDDAVKARKVASTVGEAWRMAREGRGALLLVEEDFHYPARLDESGVHLLPSDGAGGPGALDDAVDDLIETVLGKGGRVVFVDDGALAAHDQVALILRY